MQLVNVNLGTVQKLEADMVRVEVKPNHHIKEEDLYELLPVYEELFGENYQLFLLTVFNPGVSIALETRNKFATKERSAFKIAEAFVIKSLAHKIIADFVLRIQKPNHLIKVFSDEEEAHNWLKSYKKELV